MHSKSLWIKASTKCINVNVKGKVNVYQYEWTNTQNMKDTSTKTLSENYNPVIELIFLSISYTLIRSK